MNCRFFFIASLLIAIAVSLSACSGGSDGPFDRFTAQALDSDGNPLDGVAVLVNGSNSGITSDNQGFFQIDESYFSKGINSVNRVSIGERGIVFASREIVPSHNRNVIFQFAKSKGPTGAVTGYVYDDYSTMPLSNAKLILMNENLGLFQCVTHNEGYFNFFNIPEGNYRLSVRAEGYHAGIAMIRVDADGLTYQGVSLQPQNKARFEEGVMVSGYVLDTVTQAPISGVSLTMTVDTGYIGMPEPWMDGPENNNPLPDEWEEGSPGDGISSPAPPRYDSQYQETETNQDGYFEFPDPAIGYGIFLNYWKDGYTSDNEYFDIYDAHEDLSLNLTLKALVMTSATGKVVDDDGLPIKGAYVEFIFAGEEIKNYHGDDSQFGMPSDPGWDGFEEAVGNSRGGGEPQAPSGMSDPDNQNPVDNPIMQRYRWEHQNEREGSYFGGGYTGFYAVNTDDQGEFTIDELPVGAYYYFVSAYKHQSDNGDLEVVENPESNYFEFVLANIPVGSVMGVVVDEFGKAIPDALVNCVQPNIDPFAYTNELGEYRIDNIPVGYWIISAFKYGYITESFGTDIGEDEVITIDHAIHSYEPPVVTTVHFTGQVLGSMTSDGIDGVRMIFTTSDNQFFSDTTSGENGFYHVELIPTEYNVLIQHPDFQDLYMGFWVDTLYPEYDFWMWSIYGNNNGPWGGIMPGGMGMLDEGAPTGAPQEGGGYGGDDGTPFDPDEIFDGRRDG